MKKPTKQMKKQAKQNAMQRVSEIRRLVCEWDPIGVMDDPEWPRDEYDCLLGPLLRLLEAKATEEEIAKFLKKEIDEHFGLSPNAYDFSSVAAKIREGYSRNWPETASD